MKTTFLSSSIIILAATSTQAAIIVDLDPSLARFDSLTDNDDAAGGFAAGNPTAAENNQGLTFNVTFTPAAGDLDSATAAVNLIEIGGDANGTGLYLLNGELHFISKMNGGTGNVPGGFNDLDWSSGNNMIGVTSTFGPLSAGIEYSVAVVFDPITSGTLQIGVLPTGGSLTLDSFDLIGRGTRSNWSGDDSATAFRGNPPNVVGNLGGANIVGGNPFSEAAMNSNPFEGTQGQGLYWSLNGTIIPEPSGAVLGLLGMLGLLARRRR
jgi:hypothetical protein